MSWYFKSDNLPAFRRHEKFALKSVNNRETSLPIMSSKKKTKKKR